MPHQDVDHGRDPSAAGQREADALELRPKTHAVTSGGTCSRHGISIEDARRLSGAHSGSCRGKVIRVRRTAAVSRLANKKGRHRDKLFVGRGPVTPHEDGQPRGLIEHCQSVVPCIWPVSEALPSRSEKGLGPLDVWSALCRVRGDHDQYAADLKWQKGLRRELMSLEQICS